MILHALQESAEEVSLDPRQSQSYLEDVVAAIRERAVASVAIMVLVPSAFLLYAFVTPKVYRAVVTVAPATSDRTMGGLSSALGELGGLAALAGLAGGRDSSTDEAIAVLRSRAFTVRFLESSAAFHDILQERFDGDAAQSYRVFRYFDAKVRSVSENRRTGLYTISIDWTDREQAAVWANSLVRQLNSEMRSRAIDEAQQSLKFLNEQLARAEQVAVREAVGRLIEAQVKQRMFASVTEEYAFRIVDPAVPSAPQEHVYPIRILFAMGGAFVATFLVVGIAMIRVRSRTSRGGSGVASTNRQAG